MEQQSEQFTKAEISEQIKKRRRQEFEEKIRAFKRQFLGSRYENACISKIGKNLNEECQIALKKYMEKKKNFLLFLGNAGIGKTYITAALVDWGFRCFDSRRFFHERDLQSEVRSAMFESENKGDYFNHLKRLIDNDLLLLDDVGSHHISEFREELFSDVVDIRYKDELPTIIISNFSKKDFHEQYHPRICSRLFASENTVIEIMDGEDLRQMGY